VDLGPDGIQDLAFPVITDVDARPIRTAAEARDALKRQVSRPVAPGTIHDRSRPGVHRYLFVELDRGKSSRALERIAGAGAPFTMANVEDAESLDRARNSILLNALEQGRAYFQKYSAAEYTAAARTSHKPIRPRRTSPKTPAPTIRRKW